MWMRLWSNRRLVCGFLSEQDHLAAETSTGTDRKRKMKALVDSMNAEKATLEQKLAVSLSMSNLPCVHVSTFIYRYCWK